jgi:CHAT domain-containing protein
MKNVRKTIIAMFLGFFFCLFSQAQTISLELNKPIEREITGGQIHSYQIKADRGEFFSIIIDQKSADISAVLLAPDGKKLLEIDDPQIKRGPEQLLFISANTGNFRLDLTAKETGRYSINLETLRNQTPTDEKRIEAESAFIEAEKLNGEQAISKYQESLNLLNGLSDKFGEAKTLYGLGKTYLLLGNQEKSNDYFRQSLKLFQTAGSWDEIFKDLTPLYFVMGGKEKTFDYLSGADSLVKALKNERLEAILLTALAKICQDLNQTEKSLDYQNQALALFQITGKRGTEVFTLTEIADADLSLEDKKRAIDYLNQAILLSQGASDKALEVSLLTGIGYIYVSIDEPQLALNYFQKTLPLWRELKDRNGEAYALNFIGTIYFLLGDFAFARDYLEQSPKIFREIGDLRAEGYANLYLGAVETRFGNSNQAFDHYQRSLSIFQQRGEKRGEASALAYLAEIFWSRGEKQKALDNYQRSLSIWRVLNFREGEAISLSNLGFVYDLLGDPEKAADFHRQALPIFRLLGNQTGEAATLYGMARTLYAKGKLDESLTNIESAITLIESIRTKITSTELRTTYLATNQHFYRFYIDLLMEIHQRKPTEGYDARALQASERARARSLLDILNEARVDIRRGVEPALLERERNLQKQLNIKDEGRKRAKNPAEIEAIDKEIRQLNADLNYLLTEIKQKNPHYAALTQPEPIGFKEIQKLLDNETLLLEYSLGERNSYLWVVSNNSLKTFILPQREELEKKARQFYEWVNKPDEAPNSPDFAGSLSKLLLEPAAAELQNKRLLIVADGLLQYIPFAALPNPKSKIQNPKSDEPLIADHEIVYLPSASALAVLRNESPGRKAASKTLAVLADPVFEATDTRVNRETGDSAKPNALQKVTRDAGFNDLQPLPRLPATRAEARTILALVAESEKKEALDFEASLTTVKSEELASYRIVHFATHGLLNTQNPAFSGLVLSLVNEKGKAQDGFLRLHEIYNLKLPADLIVLSACQTALGKEVKGEGLVGLTRGFMYAGAKSVVASLWAVDDKATSELMKLFYQNMLGEKKIRPSAALREAQITMWKSKRFNPPYFWSAFTIQGEWR